MKTTASNKSNKLVVTSHSQIVAVSTSAPINFNFTIDKSGHTPIAYSLYTNVCTDTYINFEGVQMVDSRFYAHGFARGITDSHNNTVSCIITWVVN